jgi:CheY-like chemotaxis protein
MDSKRPTACTGHRVPWKVAALPLRRVIVPSTGKLLLVVDPFTDEREMYAEFFRASGYEVEACRNAHAALHIVTQSAPTAIVTRIRLAGTIDGIELTPRVRSAEEIRDIPVIIITTHMEQHMRQAAVEAGCDSYFLLPCPMEVILGELRRVSSMRSAPALSTSPSSKHSTGSWAESVS